MFTRIIKSIRRKIARRLTKTYPSVISHFEIPGVGTVQFANWANPLVSPKIISASPVHFFKKFVNTGDVALDIGANIGVMSTHLALAVGKSGKVLAFDPNPFVFQILEENSKLNPELTNIEVFNYAITDSDAEYYYNSSEASFNNGGISKEKNSRHGKYALSTKIKGIHLENFLSTHFGEILPKISLIKIDTEGYDREIIKSISGFLYKYKPTVISECFGKTNAEERFEHFNALHSLGYTLYYFSDFDNQAEIIPIKSKEDMLKWRHFDLVAIYESDPAEN